MRDLRLICFCQSCKSMHKHNKTLQLDWGEHRGYSGNARLLQEHLKREVEKKF
jgi:hypothetical protein